MKRFSFIMALPLVMLVAGCAGGKEPAAVGKGSVVLECSVAGGVDALTRAETKLLPDGSVPDKDDLKLVVSNAEGGVVKSYGRAADYDAPLFWTGDYTFEFSYGDADGEGPGKAWFYRSQPLTIVARKEMTQTVTVKLANSLYSLVLTDWFKNYYDEYSLVITTGSGYAHTFAGSKSEPLTETPVFVRAGTKLYMSGTAVKTNGVEVAFSNTEICPGTAACSWHTVTADLSGIGDGSLAIRLEGDDELVNVPVEIELNPDPKED